MNLHKNNAITGDWDVLAENTNMVIGDLSEDHGLSLPFFFGDFGFTEDVIVGILDGITLDHILNWVTDEEMSVATPLFINKTTPTVDTDIWSKSPNIFMITCRISATNKESLEGSARGLALVVLSEGDTSYDVWIRSIESHYEGDINFSKPWLMVFELIEND